MAELTEIEYIRELVDDLDLTENSKICELIWKLEEEEQAED